jgi:diaminopimelate epimerase
MEILFTKMHGTGNDFIVIDCRERRLADPARFAATYCDRRFGIGADQVLLLCASPVADFAMKIFNADGSEVEMCGNGIRCLARYIWTRGLSTKKMLDIETPAGIIRPEQAGNLVRVDMGEPVFDRERIPVIVGQGAAVGSGREGGAPVVNYPLVVGGREFLITCVSMGNPHAVIFLDESVQDFGVTRYGPQIERHPIFPRRTNVEFVNVKSRGELVMRVWERGSGETLACGTGASAAGVAAMLKGLTDRKVTMHLLGGNLVIEWGADNRVFMTGPAVEVFEGRLIVKDEEHVMREE